MLSPELLSVLVRHLQKGDLKSHQVLFPYGYAVFLTSAPLSMYFLTSSFIKHFCQSFSIRC